jgi:hypothetical protein
LQQPYSGVASWSDAWPARLPLGASVTLALRARRELILACRSSHIFAEADMFAIEWLKDGTLVEREASVLLHDVDVIDSAKRRAAEVAKRHAGAEPDSFRLVDGRGNEIRVFALDGPEIAHVLRRIMVIPGSDRTMLV